MVFLFNADSQTLVGPFTALESDRPDLEPGAWKETVNNHSISTNINVEWEELHEIKDAQEKFPFLKSQACKLTHFQTQDLLNALKEASLFKIE